MFFALIPPVGIILTLVYAAHIALIIASPPAASAGKNLTLVRPRLTAWASSDGVTIPGTTSIFFEIQ